MTTLTIAAQDSTTMIGRELKHTLRFPLLLIGSILGPVVFLLLFVILVSFAMMHFFALEDFFSGLSLTVIYLYMPLAVFALAYWLIRWNPLVDYVYSWLIKPK